MTVMIKRGKVRGFVRDRFSGLPATGAVAVLEAELDDNLWVPTGVLAADRAGYLSYDLEGIRSGGRESVKSMRLRIGAARYDLSPQLDLNLEAPQFVLDVDAAVDGRSSVLPAVQAPDDADRAISPGSFSAPPTTVIGEGACEQLVPAGLAGFEYGIYRVIRLDAHDVVVEESDGGSVGRARASGSRARLRSGEGGTDTTELAYERRLMVNAVAGQVVGLNDSLALPDGAAAVGLGVVLEFRQRWQPLGQSLGDIVYSLPLAPGESRDVAIIDWSRTDSLSRVDTADLSEKLLHHQSRDRTLDESISAGLHEHQEGWSFMAGIGGAAAATGTDVVGSVVPALGIAIASSTGERNLAAFNQQTLADAVSQTTSALRSLRSTVVVQASQAEANVVQTRTITNYNRCHALTVQYYEVLRNYRVVTELARAAPAVLVPHDLVTFDRPGALHWREALERHLLDPSLAGCFDSLAALERCAETAYLAEEEGEDSEAPTQPAPDPRVLPASYTVTLDTGARETWGAIWVNLVMDDGQRFVIFFKDSVDHAFQTAGGVGAPIPGTLSPELQALELGRNSRKVETVTSNAGAITGFGVDLRKVEAVEVEWVESNGNDAWSFQGIEIDVALQDGTPVPVLVNGKRLYRENPEIRRFDDSGSTHLIWTGVARIETQPSGTTPSTAGGDGDTGKQTPARTYRDLRADECCAAQLLGHLQDNRAYYSRVVWIGMDPTERRLRLLAAFGAELADRIDDTPLAVGGNQVAFRLTDPTLLSAERLSEVVGEPRPLTRYVVMPARGVFAEAELGRCVACEKRDVTLADPWIPIRPPQIEDVTPGPRGATPTVQPTQIPAPVVQLMQPLAAPDPVGLAAALELLGRPDIFRDMSGMRELRQLLDGLASGAVSLTEAQILAQSVKEKQAAATTSRAARDGTAPTTRSQASEADAGRQVDRLDVIRKAKDDGTILPSDARGAALAMLGGERAPGDILLTGGGRAPAPKTGLSGIGRPRKPSSGTLEAVTKLIEWGLELGQAALASDEEKLGEALSNAAVKIAEREITAAVDAIPMGKAFRVAVRLSLVYAEGVGNMIEPERVSIQRIVDEAAMFSDDMTEEDKERILRARSVLALGWQRMPAILAAGLDAVVEDLINQGTDLLADAAAALTSELIEDIAAKLLASMKADRVYEAVAREVGNNVPEARRRLYATLAKKLVRQLIATVAGTETQRQRLEALVPSGGEDPQVAVLRGLIDIAIGDAIQGVFPLSDVFTPATVPLPEDRLTLTGIVEYEAKRAAKQIIDELKDAGWTFGSHTRARGIDVDEAAQTIDLPSASRAELEDGPTLPAGELGLLDDDLRTDEAALASVVDGLEAGILLRAVAYQVEIDQAPGSGWIARFEEANNRSQEDASDANAAIRAVTSWLRGRYANTSLASVANAALVPVVIEPATLRPPPPEPTMGFA